MICYACQKGMLKQDYASTIYCPACNTKWNCNFLKGASSRARFKYDMERTNF